MREGSGVRDVREAADEVVLDTTAGRERHDAVVLATGAWLGGLARRFGVTGMLVARTVLEGEAPPELRPFDPLR